MSRKDPGSRLVEYPSGAYIPERDLNEMPVLEARHLSIEFGGLSAVDDFSITLGKTEIAGLIGPNGAGKTTVFNLLTNVYEPTRGNIMVNGYNTTGKSTFEVSKMGLARTFQNIRLFSNMSVLDNVKVGMHNRVKEGIGSALFHSFGFSAQERYAKEKSMELLKFFDLEGDADKLAGNLPYGAQRRLEIIRALATDPKLLLLDEPAAGMNPHETAELMENILKIRDTFKIGVFLIEHDMNLVMGICEGIVVMNFGKIIAKGDPDQIRNNPDVIEAYLGRKGD